MGTFSNWSYTAKCTVWPVTTDEYDQPTYGSPVVYDCSFKAGGRLANDDRGEQFLPRTEIWLEAEDADAPAVGSYVVTGQSSAITPPDNAEVIRVVMKHDPSLFNEGTPDWVLLTS